MALFDVYLIDIKPNKDKSRGTKETQRITIHQLRTLPPHPHSTRVVMGRPCTRQYYRRALAGESAFLEWLSSKGCSLID